MPPDEPSADRHAPVGVPLVAMCGHLLRRAQQHHTAVWAQEVGEELTGPQYAVLAALEMWPGADQRQVGTLASLDRTSTAEVVRRLEARGWLTRDVDPQDARRDVLALAPDAALQRVHQRVRSVQVRLLEPLPSHDRAPFVQDLAVIARIDENSAPPRSEGSPLRIPGHLLRRAQQVHTDLFAETLGREVTGPQYAAMHVLVEHPDISQVELGDRTALDRSTTADLVARLERRGWLVRERDPKDGRRRVLALTFEGSQVAAAGTPMVLAVQNDLLSPLPTKRRAAFLRRLGVVARVTGG